MKEPSRPSQSGATLHVVSSPALTSAHSIEIHVTLGIDVIAKSTLATRFICARKSWHVDHRGETRVTETELIMIWATATATPFSSSDIGVQAG